MQIGSMSDIITKHLKALTDFGGREARSEFWPYIGLVLAATMITMMAGSLVLVLTARGVLHPDKIIVGMAVISIIVIALIAAAVARRLHDRGLSGAWGLPPLPLL